VADPLSLAVSGTSILISGTVAWLTLLRRGKVKMTKPTIVCFGSVSEDQKTIPKVFLRTLLYCTAKRGIVVENMFINVYHDDSCKTFSIWAYRDKDLVRGSGIYVGMEGVALEHHFHPLEDSNFIFSPGNYLIEVFALTVGGKRSLKLAKINLSLTDKEASLIAAKEGFVWFDWEPNLKSYIPQLLTRPQKSSDSSLLEKLLLGYDGRNKA
jgi:hypothetical protein